MTGYGNALNAEDMTHFDASIDLVSCPQAPGQIFTMTSTL